MDVNWVNFINGDDDAFSLIYEKYFNGLLPMATSWDLVRVFVKMLYMIFFTNYLRHVKN